MTKQDIVNALADEVGLTKQAAKELVQKTFDAIIEVLMIEKRVEIRNFGVFEVVRRAPRSARNLNTNETVEVESRLAVSFKPGKEMKERLRDLEERERIYGAIAREVANPNTDNETM